MSRNAKRRRRTAEDAAAERLRLGEQLGLWRWAVAAWGTFKGQVTDGRMVDGNTTVDLLDKLRRAVDLDEDAKIKWDE